MRRVLVLVKGLGLGGSEWIVLDAARRLPQTTWQVDVAYALPWKDALVPEFEAAGVSVRCLGGARGRGWILPLRRLISEGRFDVIHAHSPVLGAAARSLDRGGVHVTTEHNVWERFRPPTRWASAATIGRARSVIAVSEAVAASIRRRIGARTPAIRVIHHGPDRDRLRAQASPADLRRELGLPPDVPIVGTVGNLKAAKAHEVLLDAAALVRRRVPEARFVLIGDGPRAAALRTHAERLGLRGSVRFLGSRADVPRLVSGFDAFALTSRFEGLPIAMLEAMSLGITPVVSAVGGCSEVVRDGIDGVLVPPADAAATADAIVRVLEDGAFRARLSAAAARRAASFDAAQAAAAVAEVYEEALS